MMKTVLLGGALLCAHTINAEARPRVLHCVETGSVMAPQCLGNDFLAGVKSIKVTLHRERRADTGTSFGDSLARPLHYIAGRLICAINVNAALAERGIRGTGSALAHSFDHWGIRVPGPVVGAVAVTDRRGGGHVAIVSRVEGSRVFVWNPSPRGRGWREVEYTNRHARYRVAG